MLAPEASMALVGTTTHDLSAYIGQRDVTSLVKWEQFSVSDSGANARSLANLRLEAALSAVPELAYQAPLWVYDKTDDANVFLGFVTMYKPSDVPTYTWTDVTAVDVGSLLDDQFIVYESRPAESMQARIGFLWGKYAVGWWLSGDLSGVASIGGTLPATEFTAVSLRAAVEATIAQASASADYYVDARGALQVFTSSSNTAPYAVVDTAPAGGQISPEAFSVEFDGQTWYDSVYVQGANPAGSGLFWSTSASSNGVHRTATIQAADCTTAAMAQALANMYLGRVDGIARGTFTITATGGWRAGQVVTVTNADAGLSAASYKITRVTTTVAAPGGTPQRRHVVEFGGAQLRNVGGSVATLGMPVGQVVSGQLGGNGNVYVTGSGVSVTDGSSERVRLGNVGGLSGVPATTTYGLWIGDGGIVVTNAGGTVIIDGTSDMFKVAATGTISHSLTGGSIASSTSVTLTGLGALSGTPAFLGYMSQTNTSDSTRRLAIINFVNFKWAAATSGGAVTSEIVGLDAWALTECQLDGSSQAVVLVAGSNAGSTISIYGRYYVLQETAI